MPVLRNIIHRHRHYKKYQHTTHYRRKNITKTKRFDLLRTDIGNKRSSPAGRMHGLRYLHANNGQRYRQSRRQPHHIREQFMNGNTHYRTYQVSAYQVARLCQRTVRSAKYQHRRCPERTDQEYTVHVSELRTLYQPYGSNTDKAANERPEQVRRLYDRLLIDYVLGYAVASFYSLFQCSTGIRAAKIR